MNRCYEVEYCNLELKIDRLVIQNFISNLIEAGYSLYWNENEQHFIISIRSGKDLLKFKFERAKGDYRMVGNYSIRDQKLAELFEKMISTAQGHAVVKRFKNEQILIDNIMYGEVIRTVEITGVKHKVIFQKDPMITVGAITKAFKSTRVEKRIPVLRMELDYELATLYELMQENDTEKIEACKERLKALRQEMLLAEC